MFKDTFYLFTRGVVMGIMAYLFVAGFFISYHAVRTGGSFKYVLIGICIGVCSARIYFAAVKQFLDIIKERLDA